MPHVVYDQPTAMSSKVEPEDIAYEDELLLKWDDHHKSFFELAEDLCHQVRAGLLVEFCTKTPTKSKIVTGT
jgi:hypothetical protein